MENLEKNFKLLVKQQRDLRAAMRRPKAIEGQIQKTLDRLRENIRAGGTVGDKIVDFVILRYGWGSAEDVEILRFYRALDAKFRGSVGQFVLLTHTYQHQYCYRGPESSRPEDFITTSDHYLGIIKDGGLILLTDNDSWELPTEKYVLAKSGEEAAVRTGNITAPNSFFDLYIAVKKLAYIDYIDATISLLIGDDEIKIAEFRHQQRFEPAIFKKYAALLGRAIE